MTSEDVQRTVRIAFYLIAGNLMQRGYLSEAGAELALGVVMALAMLVWSVWGMRINAKLAEITKYGEVKRVVAAPQIAHGTMKDNPKVVAR